MRIVIDARMYGLGHAGIGRYVANLIRELKTQIVKVKSTEIFLLIRKKNYHEIKEVVGDIFRLVIVDVPHYSWAEQIILPLQLIKLKPDLVHFPHFNVPIFYFGKYVVTIHDLIKHFSRGSKTTTRWQPFYWFKYLNYRVLVWLVIKRAAKVITPSEWWRQELIRRYHLNPSKVIVTYEGVGEKFKTPSFAEASEGKQISKLLEKYKIERPFVIYTGSLYPHKNVERLVEAVKHLNNLTLVVVCARNIFYERFQKKVRQLGAENLVNLVGFVPDEELAVLYKQAEAFVFPSLLEGFGLPGLEAMACGLPVVASNSSCLPEIYGDAALYFNPLDIDDIAEKINLVLNDKTLRTKLIQFGYKQVQKYSWQKMARETLRTYQSVLE